jgi:TonB family protein
MQLTLAAVGEAELAQRRAFAWVEPGRGSVTPHDGVASPHDGVVSPHDGVVSQQRGAARSVSAQSAPAQNASADGVFADSVFAQSVPNNERQDATGFQQSAGDDASGKERTRIEVGTVSGKRQLERRAPVAAARPDVQRAFPAVPTEQRARPQDTLDSTQAVSERVASLISASTLRAGTQASEGGDDLGQRAGSDGRATGSSGSPSGHDTHGQADVATDPRLVTYYSYVRSRLRPLTDQHFPLWAKAKGWGGLAILSFQISEQGTIDAIQIARPSGIAEFDENLVAALRRLQLDRPPSGKVPIRFRFDAMNPAVRNN